MCLCLYMYTFILLAIFVYQLSLPGSERKASVMIVSLSCETKVGNKQSNNGRAASQNPSPCLSCRVINLSALLPSHSLR